MSANFSRSLLLFLFVPPLVAGCAADGLFARHEESCLSDDCSGPQFVQFERGQPHVVVDSIGWVFGIPSRVLLWNWDVKSHNISIDTEQQLRAYVAAGDLRDVKVRLNQYDPGGEWQRLAHNDHVGPGWRYTLGALSTLGYTVFPGRLFAIDYYNPFTNTVNVYSDVPALGMKEVAYADDVINRELPGTYAFSQMIPGVSLVHETITTRQVLDYVAATGSVESHKEAVHVLYPSYGGSVGGAVDYFLPTAPVMQLGGVVVGHVTGRWETRGWASADPLLLSENEPEAQEIRVTPPRKFFADTGALPIGLNRSAIPNGTAPNIAADEVTAPAATTTPQLVEKADDPAAGDPAGDAGKTGPADSHGAREGEILQAAFETAADLVPDAAMNTAEDGNEDSPRPDSRSAGDDAEQSRSD